MKKILLFILLMAAAVTGIRAQQRIQYSQYLLNSFLVNPAVGGAERYLDVKAGWSQQWVGFEGAPRGLYLSLNKGIYPPASSGTKVTSLPVRGRVAVDPTQEKIEQIGGDNRNFHLGLGGTLFSETAGPISYNGISGAFSGHLRLTRELRLSIGASMEILNYRLDPTSITFLEANDVVIPENTTNLFLPSVNAGFALYTRSVFLAGATRQLLQNRVQINPQNPVISGLEVHYLLQGGFRVRVGQGVSFVPSLILRYIAPAPVSWEVSLRSDIRDLLSFGLSYRHQDALIGIIGVNLNHRVALQYSYDYTTSALSNVSSGTHSLVLALRLANPTGAPRTYFW
ncbi:MAG: type IX secretion system membrane protein PorP/SprF [Bacteroidota bacterium]